MKKIEDYKGTKTAIKVNSIEEFDKIKKLLGHTKQSGVKCFSKINNCVSCMSDDYCYEIYFLDNNYTIYPASDFSSYLHNRNYAQNKVIDAQNNVNIATSNLTNAKKELVLFEEILADLQD